jgi:hypothetical protein
MAIYRDTVGIVFKTSNRRNAKVKIKVMQNKTVDQIVGKEKIPGIPDSAIILEVGFGIRVIESYKKKYKL